MHRARSVLIAHRLTFGPLSLCVDQVGNPTSCTWKPSRRRGASGAVMQHIEHQAQLISQAYETDILMLTQLRNVEDLLADEAAFAAAMPPATEFQRGRVQAFREVTDALGGGKDVR